MGTVSIVACSLLPLDEDRLLISLLSCFFRSLWKTLMKTWETLHYQTLSLTIPHPMIHPSFPTPKNTLIALKRELRAVVVASN